MNDTNNRGLVGFCFVFGLNFIFLGRLPSDPILLTLWRTLWGKNRMRRTNALLLVCLWPHWSAVGSVLKNPPGSSCLYSPVPLTTLQQPSWSSPCLSNPRSNTWLSLSQRMSRKHTQPQPQPKPMNVHPRWLPRSVWGKMCFKNSMLPSLSTHHSC